MEGAGRKVKVKMVFLIELLLSFMSVTGQYGPILLVIFTFTNDDGMNFAADCTNEAFVMAGEYDLEAGGNGLVC